MQNIRLENLIFMEPHTSHLSKIRVRIKMLLGEKVDLGSTFIYLLNQASLHIMVQKLINFHAYSYRDGGKQYSRLFTKCKLVPGSMP